MCVKHKHSPYGAMNITHGIVPVMNDNTMAKSLTLTQDALQSLIANAVAKATGLPTTQARVSQASDMAPLKGKSKLQDDVVVFVTQSMADKRMKLPARMANGKSQIIVDDYKIDVIESDRGRSTKLSPSDYFDADPGDTITFTHLGGNKWDYEVVEGTKADKARARIDGRSGEDKPKAKAKAQNARAPKAASKPAQSVKGNGKIKAERVVRDEEVAEDKAGDKKAIRNFIKRYADMAITNHDDNPKYRNTNITSSNTKAQFGLKQDARELLLPKQSQQFRRERKRLGLGLKRAITMLNEAVYE